MCVSVESSLLGSDAHVGWTASVGVPMSKPLDVRSLLRDAASGGKAASRPSCSVDKDDDLTYDIGHLYAFDPSPIDEAEWREDPAAYLKRTARENAQLMMNRLYGLLEAQASKQMIELPRPTMALPREKPLPEDKAQTRWEKFAQDKGIVKKKRSKMVWDETTQQWAPRYGYGRANNFKDAPENWVVEAKPGDDGSVDPFEARSAARKEKLNKQKRQEERNRLEAAHAATIGTGGGGGGGKGQGGSALSSRDEKKAYLKRAISAAQTSTASVGRFDAPVAGEPSKTAGKRKHYNAGVGASDSHADAKRTASVVDKMFPDDGRHHAKVVDRVIAAKVSKKQQESKNARGEGKAKPAKVGGGRAGKKASKKKGR
jgi:regulator of ribosome biosynthesis